tara:strand:+ start:34 stop:1161 length:1128 start_codon:yes stop_codon:yes gene_type:complete
MKILVLANNTRAINHFRINLIYNLAKQYDVFLVAKYNEQINKKIYKNVHYTNLVLEEDGYNIFKEIKLFFNLFFIIKSINPDLVISYTIKPNFYGSIICKILKIKNISNVFGLGFLHLITNKVIKLTFRKILKIIASNSYKIFIQNLDDKRILSQFTDLNKLVLINGSGINVEYYQKKINNKDIKYDYTYIGRIIKDKGLDEFIEAAISINKTHPNIKFCVQGEIYSNRKDRSININQFNYALDKKIITFLEYGDVVNTINSSKWIVLPSYREGSSKILQESICMGKPCLASDVPGCNNIIIDNFNGLLFEPQSSQSIKKTIIQSINLSPKQYNLYSQNCLKFSLKFDDKNTISNYQYVIDNINIVKEGSTSIKI